MIKIDLPGFLAQRLCVDHYQCEANTIGEAFSNLIEDFPQVRPLFAPNSVQPNDFASIYLNSKLINFDGNLKLENSDTITIMTAVSGG